MSTSRSQEKSKSRKKRVNDGADGETIELQDRNLGATHTSAVGGSDQQSLASDNSERAIMVRQTVDVRSQVLLGNTCIDLCCVGLPLSTQELSSLHVISNNSSTHHDSPVVTSHEEIPLGQDVLASTDSNMYLISEWACHKRFTLADL